MLVRNVHRLLPNQGQEHDALYNERRIDAIKRTGRCDAVRHEISKIHASVVGIDGVAAAMAATGLPYALAPVIDADGALLDGTPLADAIRRIDAEVAPRPLHYLTGCVHPTTFRAARQHGRALPGDIAGRVIGLKANASNLPPDQLDKLDHLEEGQPERFAELMLDLRRDYGLQVLGGCCGTDDRHIRAIASRLALDAS